MFRETSTAAVEKAMQSLSVRMQAIADNIANAETPGYRPREVEFEAALREAIDREEGEMGRPGSMRVVEETGAQVRRAAVPPALDVTVQIEKEMTDLARTTGHHEALARVLGKQFRMLRSAISGGSQS